MTAATIDNLTLENSRSSFRPLISLVIAVFVTTCLFWIMQNLIATADHSLDHEGAITIMDFVRVERDEEPDKKKIEKPTIPPRPDVQPRPPSPTLESANPTVIEIALAPAPVSTDVNLSGTYNLGTEGDYLPIVKVAPIYPTRALTRGLEGSCVVQYTVTQLGTIKDPVVVQDQCSSSLFYDASINAALKFKYKPRTVDGKAVAVTGVQNKFTFEIVD